MGSCCEKPENRPVVKGKQHEVITDLPTHDGPPPGPVTVGDSDNSSDISLGIPTWKLKGISEHPSFCGKMSGSSARGELEKSRHHFSGNCYLTRYSRRKDEYILSVTQRGMSSDDDDFIIRHYKLNINKHTHNRSRIINEIEGTEEQFDSIFDLLSFYERNPIDHEIHRIGQPIESDRHRQFCLYYNLHDSPPPVRALPNSEKCKIEARDLEKILDNNFTLADLKSITWANDRREIKHFNLSERVSNTWEGIATMLGMDIFVYEQKTDDNVRRFEDVVSDWIEHCAQDQNYPATWRGLLELLVDLERTTAADNLTRALKRRIV